MMRLQKACEQFVPSVVAINVEMFGAFMENGVLSNVDGSLVVTIESDGKGKRNMKIMEEKGEPFELKSGVGHSPILSLGKRLGHSLLLLGLPRNQRRTKKDAVTGKGTRGELTRSSIGITVGSEMEGGSGRIEQPLVNCGFEIAKYM